MNRRWYAAIKLEIRTKTCTTLQISRLQVPTYSNHVYILYVLGNANTIDNYKNECTYLMII